MRFTLFLFLIINTYSFSQTLPNSIKYLALGDSYTIGSSVNEFDRWPNQFIDSLQKVGFQIEKNDIIATAGWTTSSLLQAIGNSNFENDYNLVSILIGVNNFYQKKSVDLFRKELTAIIDSALIFTNQDTNALFLVTIPDYGYTPFGQGQLGSISVDTDLYNSIKDSTAKVYGINVYDITDISRQGLIDVDLIAVDDLHPSAKQYSLWVDKIIGEMIGLETLKLETKFSYFELTQGPDYIHICSKYNGFISISDINGKRVYAKEVNENISKKLTLKKGVYIVSMQNKSVLQVEKIVIN